MIKALGSALVCVVVTLPLLAGATDWTAKVYLPRDKAKSVQGLDFQRTDVVVRPATGGRPPSALLRGSLDRPGWGLYAGGKWVLRKDSPTRNFAFAVPISGEKTVLAVKVVNPQNKAKTVKLMVYFSKWSTLQTGLLVDDQPYQTKSREAEAQESELSTEGQSPSADRRTSFEISLGGSSIAYSESGVPDFTMTGVTGKLSLLSSLSPRKWDFLANAFATLLPLSSNRVDTTVRFAGLNGRLGYHLIDESSWILSLQAGLYYSTMLVSTNAFGFKNMLGPSGTVSLRFILGLTDAVGLYLKYAIVAGLSPTDRELAMGANYAHTLDNGHPVIVSLDYSAFDFVLLETAITSSSISASIGYGF